MMKAKTSMVAIVVAFMAIAAGCSKARVLSKRLDGTWNVTKYEGTSSATGISGTFPFAYTNIGTITFKSDNTGSYSYTIAGSKLNSTFTWDNTGTSVTITEPNKTPVAFTVTTNEKTNQVWTANLSDANGTTNLTMTLTKQ